MKNLLILIIVMLVGINVFAQSAEKQQFYVGTFTSEGAEGIYLCSFNTNTGDISLENTFKGFNNPSFLKASTDKKYLYVVSRANKQIESSGGYVSSYKIAENGKLEFLNKQVSNGADPCHLDVSNDGIYVAIATYGGGTTSLYSASNGKLSPAISVVKNGGSGFLKSRQAAPHAHSIKFSPFGDEVFSADLGTDKLNRFILKNGKLVQSGQTFIKLDPGAGPRHFDFDKSGKGIYVINELSSTISSIVKVGEEWTQLQTISTLPDNFDGESYCADIHVSANGKFLYGSNRGHNSIVVYSIDENSRELKNIDFVSVEGNWPRNFSLTPNGEFMLVANQKSGNITVFKINAETGIPEFTGKEIKIPSPVCIEFL